MRNEEDWFDALPPILDCGEDQGLDYLGVDFYGDW